MGERTIVEKLEWLRDAWSGYHIGDVAAEALTHVRYVESEIENLKHDVTAAMDTANLELNRAEKLQAKLAAVEKCGVLRKRAIEEMLAVDDTLEFISYNQLQAAAKEKGDE